MKKFKGILVGLTLIGVYIFGSSCNKQEPNVSNQPSREVRPIVLELNVRFERHDSPRFMVPALGDSLFSDSQKLVIYDGVMTKNGLNLRVIITGSCKSFLSKPTKANQLLLDYNESIQKSFDKLYQIKSMPLHHEVVKILTRYNDTDIKDNYDNINSEITQLFITELNKQKEKSNNSL